jgi:hypothetical protein
MSEASDDDARDRLKWQLVSVLFSTQPLTASLARVLFDAAWELYRSDGERAPIRAPLAQGHIENLRKDVLLGTVGGPSFEATIDTERGAATVRFVITRQGLELMAQQVGPEQLN